MSFLQDALEPAYATARAYALYVVNTRDALPYRFARDVVYGADDPDLDVVYEKINDVRRLTIDRLFNMARFALRMPVRGLMLDERYCDQDRLLRAFMLGIWCRPTCVVYPPKTQTRKFKSCGCANFCPACWASVTARQCEQCTDVITDLLAANVSTIAITARVSEEFVPAPQICPTAYAEPETLVAAANVVHGIVKTYKRRLEARRKQVQRKTLAACWRLVLVPAEGGWRLQCRQFMLTKPAVAPPVLRMRDATVPFSKTVCVRDSADPAIVQLLRPFAVYPRALLTEDVDLTAAGLNAISTQRMLGGSGAFRRVGDGLVRAARRMAPLFGGDTHDAGQPAKTKSR
jgi:hypothetical protein